MNTEGKRSRDSHTQLWTGANPLRFRIIELLRDGPATASQLARRLGESSGTISYHMRLLAEAGLIKEEPLLGTRRDRWWRRCPDEAVVRETDPDLQGRAITARYFSMFFGRDNEVRRRFMTREASDEWHRAASVGNWFVALTPAQAAELWERLFALVDQYRGAPASEDGAETLVSVSILPWLD